MTDRAERKRDRLISSIREIADKFIDVPAYHAILEKCMVDLKTASSQDTHTITFNTQLIESVDKFLLYEPVPKYTKYNKVSEALATGNIYGVMISINGVCYIFHSVQDYEIFQQRFDHVVYGRKLDDINIYHITRSDVKQKARLRYLSVDPEELEEVVERLAEISKTSIESIDVFPMEDESKIIMNDKVGTWDEMILQLTGYQDILQDDGDNKIKLFRKMQVGDAICPAEYVSIKKEGHVASITINHYTIEPGAIQNSVNIQGDNNGAAGIVSNPQITTTLITKKKQSDEEIAKEWINKNPYTSKKTRGEYFKKYTKSMDKIDKTSIGVQKFAAIMRSLGFIETRVGSNSKRIWELNDSDSDNENNNTIEQGEIDPGN